MVEIEWELKNNQTVVQKPIIFSRSVPLITFLISGRWNSSYRERRKKRSSKRKICTIMGRGITSYSALMGKFR